MRRQNRYTDETYVDRSLDYLHARRIVGMNARYAHFLDYGDPADFHETQARLRVELSREDCQSLDTDPFPKEGNAYFEAGEVREAIEAYRKALDRCPDFHDIRYSLGIALRDAGLPDRALSEFRRVLRGNPSYLEAQVQLGLTLYTLGRSTEALVQWRAVLEREPEQGQARMYLRLVAPEGGSEA